MKKFQPFWQEKVKLHYMDTDSFILSIETNNLEKDLEHFKDDFDFSDLDQNSPLYSSKIKKLLVNLKLKLVLI